MTFETNVKEAQRFYYTGATTMFTSQRNERFSYCLYVPTLHERTERPLPLLVIMHGTARTAMEYRDAFADFAERHGAVVLAPLFPASLSDPEELHHFKFLDSGGTRWDQVLLDIVDEVGEAFRVQRERFLLHGFSGGGQFAHRFFYLHPDRLAAVSIGAPGRVTLLDAAQPWWLGVQDIGARFGIRLDVPAMTQVPVQMVVGAEDTETWEINNVGDPNWLPGAERAGATRIERLASLRDSFTDAGIGVRFDLVPGVAHDGPRVLSVVRDFFADVLAAQHEDAAGGRPAAPEERVTPAAFAHISGYRPVVGLADPLQTRSRYPQAITGEQRKGALDLLRRARAISLHDHPIRLPEPMTATSWSRWRAVGREELGYAGIQRSGLTGIFASANSWHTKEELVTWFGRMAADLAHQPTVRQARSAGDLAALDPASTQTGVLLALETITAFQDDPDGVECLYGFGLRMAGLSYDPGNALAGGLAQQQDPGLSAEGLRMVGLLNDLGVIVDLAHVGDRSAIEAAEASRKPVTISHAGARAVWPIPRLKPDDVLRAVAATGGVIGVSAAPNSTRSRRHPLHTIDSVIDHVDYLVDLVGIEHVGFGPDTMFGDHTGLHRARGGQDGPDYAYTPTEPVPAADEVDHVDGVENPAENFVDLVVRLGARGYPEDQVAALVGGNAMRLLTTVVDDA
ncbi:MAG: poly aspartic acid hydrolase [Frankiales bacterium]|nr:poly aspartic acid hydrolase [Frankiales bacterium]